MTPAPESRQISEMSDHDRIIRTDERIENILRVQEAQLKINDALNERARLIEIDVARNLTGKAIGSDRTWTQIEILSHLVALAALLMMYFEKPLDSPTIGKVESPMKAIGNFFVSMLSAGPISFGRCAALVWMVFFMVQDSRWFQISGHFVDNTTLWTQVGIIGTLYGRANCRDRSPSANLRNPTNRTSKKGEHCMSKGFVSFLDKIGADFKKGLDVALPFAQAGAVGLSVANPALGSLVETGVAVVAQTEQKFAAMGQQSGTGPQKLTEATSILAPIALSLMQATGSKTATLDNVTTFINGLVAALNAFPAPTTA